MTTTERLAALLALLLAAGCAPPSAPIPEGAAPEGLAAPPGADRNVRFGLPAAAKADPSEREAHLIQRPQYTLSYNARTRTANWVSWELRKDDIGHAQRGPFEPDPLLPPGFARVTSHVYDGSGFDRGHLCPAQDRSRTQEDMDATFFMTNVVPQAPNCNQRGWERLESYCRGLTRDGHVLHQAAGPHGVGGTGKDGFREVIGKGRVEVTVPAKMWKVVLVLPHEGAEPTARTRTIAVIMPNDQSVGYDWTKYRVSVRAVEKLTGCDFWPAIPQETAAAIKGRVDEVEVHVPHPGRGGE
jgi:endonuclease G